MPCDPNTLLADANCILTCIPPGALPAVQVSLLCQLAGGAAGAPYVLKSGDTMTGTLVLPNSQTALKIGGLTSAFPAIGVSGGLLQIRLADNSNYGILQVGFTQANQVDASGITQPVSLELYHETSGGVGGGGINGGVSVDFRADSDTADRQQQFRVSSLWQIAANATRTSELRFLPTTLGVGTTDCLRLSNAAVDLRNGADLQIDGTAYFNPLSVYAAGTVYTLTAVSAAVDFGTTDPILTMSQVGQYVIRAKVKVALNGATFAANRTLTVKLRRTNNTPADLANSSTTWIVPIVTTITNTLAVIELPEVFYTTAVATDTIQLFADISVLPTAGSISIDEASIVAVRLNV